MSTTSYRFMAAVAQRRPNSAAGMKAGVLIAFRQRRQDLDISQQALAEKLGCSRESFCLIENGERGPKSVDFIFEWAVALGATINVTLPDTPNTAVELDAITEAGPIGAAG